MKLRTAIADYINNPAQLVRPVWSMAGHSFGWSAWGDADGRKCVTETQRPIGKVPM